MTTIALTGSEGLIGKQLKAHFESQEGISVVCADLATGVDLRNEDSVKAFMAQQPIDYLVNAFALNDHVDPTLENPNLEAISLEALREYCESNIIALFSCCRAFAMANENAKGIVNFASLYGVKSPKHFLYDGTEKHIGYTLSKHSVVGLTRHLATYYAKRLRVNCLVPGGMEHMQDEAFKSRYNEQVPMGRMMQPGELNGIVSYLCSDQSTYMTGTTIPIDGGWTAW